MVLKYECLYKLGREDQLAAFTDQVLQLSEEAEEEEVEPGEGADESHGY